MSDIIRLDMRGGGFLCLKDFASSADMDSALALIEHLTESAALQAAA